ncbi:SprT family zinc-dependent metalloprotease [Romboutsia sp.]|uniref:M48 family metallopeptidase n=1 Tax=Romboutsia sp. TaxID=1965302 RepID=UPI002C4649DF|nr:SprT family zinc-dependent metalloprotease [Romboutsia sp.]HSQ89744.1 SprT family zinc-dependent metalloprotease [Romboutsia sp.]
MGKDKNKNELCVTYKDRYIKSSVIYRKRKNITIIIKPKDNITIISPPNVDEKILKDLLIEKGGWILKKLEEYKDISDFNEEKEIKSGSKLFYLGEEYVLEIININKLPKPNIFINENKIILQTSNLESEYIKKALKDWYKKESEKVVLKYLIKCREKSKMMMNLIPSVLKVKEQKKRWGTCTSKRAIYINSKIAMARPKSIEYILVHEFSHLVHMNHSKNFYNLVESIMPEYKKEEEWLKKNSYKLTL